MLKAPPLLALLLLLALAVHASAEEDEDNGQPTQPAVLEMSRATVLASPGAPSGLEPFLPRGEAPQRLTWPLPKKGALLVLGLPASDPLAQRLADIFQLQVDAETLAGGYAIHAWQADGRNMVLVLGADAAALQAARFEFDASAPMEMLDPNMRSLDFKRPNQEAGVLVRTGTRVVRPRYATRALDVEGTPPTNLMATLSGVRANRVWLDDGYLRSADGERLRRRLAAHGVIAVHKIRWRGPRARGGLTDATAEVHAFFSASQAGTRRRHVALVFETSHVDAVLRGATYAAYEARVATLFAQQLRPHLQELIVVPRFHNDRLVRALGAPPDLRDIPEAVLAWAGPLEHATTITRADAERRVREAGVPVVLLDTWAEPLQGDLHIPTLPTGRSQDLGDVLAGVVVRGAKGTDALLESAWDGAASERFGVELLTPLVPRKEQDTLELLRVAAVRLELAARENLGLVPWMAPLAADLRTVRSPTQRLPLLLGPHGADAGVLVPTSDGIEVRGSSDGSSLFLRVRILRKSVGAQPFSLQLVLGVREDAEHWRFEMTEKTVACKSARPDPTSSNHAASDRRAHVKPVRRVTPTAYEIDIHLDRFALDGDAHELRHFPFRVALQGKPLWPSSGEAGTLVVLKP